MVNSIKLQGAIKAAGYTQETLAEELGMSKGLLSLKINNETEFKASEIFRIISLLKIPKVKTSAYFFVSDVPQKCTKR